MLANFYLVVLVLCVVIYVKSDESYGRNYEMPEYVRIKRAKYYSNPPMRFYKRPPIPHVVKGIFSYTPPPHLSEDDSPHPGNFRPNKVNKRPPPPNDGLGDEDIHNLVKNLSKQDLDKIINFAGEKYREPPFQKYNSPQNTIVTAEDDYNVYKPTLRDLETNQKLSPSKPYVSSNIESSQNVEHISSSNIAKPVSTKIEHSEPFNFISPHASSYIEPQKQDNDAVQIFLPHKLRNTNSNHQDISGVALETQESINNNQFSFVDSYIQQELNNVATRQVVGNDIEPKKPVQEEELPKPINLREDYDFEVSNTDNVPRVVKASSYKVENFGELPLMNYNSKLHTVSSYHVPHYSVISQQSHKPSSSQLTPSPSSFGIKVPTVEPAPHSSAAKEQSDAHLKAIKIWTHQSKGTAYTLHDDGTLSLEKDGRPKRPQ
ncbi:unnamed protein product [Diatraea saccharalis]|uniref:Uncharacterized protein n=1 Tax=Diatraea saccharalis TaxID=40085 RepID=A0A9N9R228_9NEOP|nr:unnamed protein product [Diatraea saccharalis]